MSHVTLAWVRLLRGDTAGANIALAAALATVPQLPIGAPTILEALVAVSLGRPQAAQLAAKRAIALAHVWSQPAFLDDQLALMLADVAVLTGDHELLASALAAAPDSPPRAASGRG